MTNISAFKIHAGKDNEPQNAVIVADSMSTALYGDHKDDVAQKLFVLNDALLASAGMRNSAIEVYEELKQSQVKGPEAIATSILDIVNRKKISAQMPLDFIVAGYEKKRTQLFYVNATGFNPYAPDNSSPSDKFMNEQFYAFSGSGMPFAKRVIEGQIDLGWDPRPRDITSGLSLMQTIAQAATESKGVNDKLQYGVITPSGMHLLFHPFMRAHNFDEHADYFKRLLNVKLSEYGEFGTEEGIQARVNNRPAWLLARDFYNAFDLELSSLSVASRDFRTICDQFKEDKVPIEKIVERRQEYHNAKKLVDSAVSALLSGSVEQIKGYLNSEHKFRTAKYYNI